MGLIPPQDASFLISESREHPMHVAGLHLFELPPDAGPDYLSDLYQDLLKHDDLRPLFRKRPAGPVSSVGQLWWTEDDDVDLEYHVRLTALPKPGTVRQRGVGRASRPWRRENTGSVRDLRQDAPRAGRRGRRDEAADAFALGGP